MSQYAAPPPTPIANPWAKRLWWLVPAGCIGVIALVVVFIGGIATFVFTLIKGSGAYENAMEIAAGHPAVIEAVGEPVEADWYVMGNIETSGTSGNADLSIPVSGPDGRGTVYVLAFKRGGEWHFEALSFQDKAGGPPIDLLEDL